MVHIHQYTLFPALADCRATLNQGSEWQLGPVPPRTWAPEPTAHDPEGAAAVMARATPYPQ